MSTSKHKWAFIIAGALLVAIIVVVLGALSTGGEGEQRGDQFDNYYYQKD